MNNQESHVLYRVPYADTDQMGVVYYANYLVYFERVRNQLLRDVGLPYSKLEAMGYALPVIEARLEYKAAAKYDDQLDICGWIGAMERVRIRIDCRVSRDDVLLVKGHTVHAFVDIDTMRPRRIIPELARLA